MRMAKCYGMAQGLALLVGLSASAAETAPLVISLRPAATVSGKQVTLGGIADLQGGDNAARARIARLDVTELPLSSQPILISREQIGFRLQLAGFAAAAYRLDGSRFVHVSRPTGEGLEERIAAAARQALERQFGGQVEDVKIQLAQPVTLPPLSAEGGDIHLEAEARAPAVPPCRVAVEVGVYVRGARRTSVIVYLDVKKLQAVPMAVRRIEAGETFGAENVRLERVAVDGLHRNLASTEGLAGRRAAHAIAAGQPIETGDVASDVPAATTAVIHTNDLVHLIATVGPLQIKARGEALQDGRIGQRIQVRNFDSKATITGKVIDHSTVEVEY